MCIMKMVLLGLLGSGHLTDSVDVFRSWHGMFASPEPRLDQSLVQELGLGYLLVRNSHVVTEPPSPEW